jgi:hypothetical protein
VNATAFAPSSYDVLLEWASELAEGSWAQWCDACAELDVEPTVAMLNLAALGHAEVDWSSNHFSCPPPTAALLHHSSGCVLLTGARPRGLLERLAEMEVQLEDLDFVIHQPCPQRRGPQTVLIEVELDDAEELCDMAELTWVFDSANRIAQMLPEATLEALASREDWPPRDDVPRRRFDLESMTYRPDRGECSERGLWSYDGYRRAEAWLFDGEHWWHLPTREYAPYLAHPEVTFLRYRHAARQLLVPVTVPLPPLQARAATLASGRLPLRASVAEPASWAYVNVSPELACRIAASLATPLERLL